MRTPISRSQLAELFGMEPAQFVGIDRTLAGWVVVSEGDDDMQTTQTFPQLADNTKRGPKKGGKRGK